MIRDPRRWTAVRAVLPLGVLTWFIPVEAPGQLQSATWTESASAAAGPQYDAAAGVDPEAPESVSATLSGETWSANAGIIYGPPGPPEVTAVAGGYYFSGSPPGLTAYSTCAIAFEVQVRRTGTPSVPVSAVPLSWVGHLAVDVQGGGGFNAVSTAEFSLVQDATVLVDTLTTASLAGLNSVAIHVAVTQLVHPEVPIAGHMGGAAGITADVLQVGTSASASAYLWPSFEVADEIIPGTSESYRDYFDVEYGAGYWALGNTPVRNTTWGRIKSLY